jgi:hypothetical protein
MRILRTFVGLAFILIFVGLGAAQQCPQVPSATTQPDLIKALAESVNCLVTQSKDAVFVDTVTYTGTGGSFSPQPKTYGSIIAILGSHSSAKLNYALGVPNETFDTGEGCSVTVKPKTYSVRCTLQGSGTLYILYRK